MGTTASIIRCGEASGFSLNTRGTAFAMLAYLQVQRFLACFIGVCTSTQYCSAVCSSPSEVSSVISYGPNHLCLGIHGIRSWYMLDVDLQRGAEV
jgi:hypothetical protein